MNEQELALEIERLRMQRSDDGRTEAKSCAGGLSSDVWESVSSFANTHGGLILLGVDERARFSYAKGFELEKVRNALVEGMGDGAPHGAKLTNPPRYTLDRVPFEGRQVLCVKVEELDVTSKPCYVTAKGVVGGAYKRVDDKDIRLSAAEIYELQTMVISAQSDREPVSDATEDDLDAARLNTFLADKRARGSKAVLGEDRRERQLRNLGILSPDGGVRLAGLLCFGRFPQGFYPKLTIDVAVFPGLRKAEPGMARFTDRVVCEGTLAEVVDQACSAITRNLRVTSYVEGVGRHDEPEMPIEVLREALTNAIVHREYGPQFIGQAVSVEMYPNRIEVLSPGGLWGGKTLDNLGDGTSRCRNDLLMSLASSVYVDPLTGSPAEGQGSGIGLMLRELEARGLPAPEFESGFDYFKVTFRRGTQREKVPIGHTDDARVLLTSAQQEVIDLFDNDRTLALNVHEMADSLGIPLGTMRSRLRGLVEARLLVPTAPATDRARKYRLADGADASVR